MRSTALRLLTVVSVAALGIVVGAVAFAVIAGAGLFSFLSNPFGSERVDRSQPALLQSIQEVSELTTAVGNFQVVLDIENDNRLLPSFLAGDRSLFVAAGTVDASVDLAGLADDDVELSQDGTSVEVALPPAELGEPNLDQERTYLYSQDRGALDRLGDLVSTSDQSDLYQEADAKLVEAATESDLLDRADANARSQLEGLFRALDLDVTFTEKVPTE